MQENYYRKYQSVIWNRNRNPLPETVYAEKHHILPKALYPQYVKDPKNIIRLTPAEHFKAHWYLVKHFEEIGDRAGLEKMLFATFPLAWRILKGNHVSDYELSQLYDDIQEVRTKYIRMMSEKKKGRPLSEEHKRKIALGMVGHHVSELTRAKMAMAKLGVKRPYLKLKPRADKGIPRGPNKRTLMKTKTENCN